MLYVFGECVLNTQRHRGSRGAEARHGAVLRLGRAPDGGPTRGRAALQRLIIALFCFLAYGLQFGILDPASCPHVELIHVYLRAGPMSVRAKHQPGSIPLSAVSGARRTPVAGSGAAGAREHRLESAHGRAPAAT
jgi:hypothetical protein